MSKNVKSLDSKDEGEPCMKKFKRSIISKHVDSAEFKELFTNHWHNSTAIKTDKIDIITEPFKICKISNFLKDDDFISQLMDELKEVKSGRKTMDLYQFEQTVDFANVESECIAHLYRTFEFDVTDWMEENTRINLTGKISMSSARYSDTDYLLCHDDNMGDRRIAFILYLSKDWTPEDGGALDIFDTDDYGQPNNIVRSLIPEYNSLVFFQVVHNSYHQVAEITSPNKVRLSINGWFHGPLKVSNKQRRPEQICKYFEPEEMEVDLVLHISKIYLYETIVTKIQRTIEKDSFIYLPEFLLPEKYEALSIDVKSESIKWEKIGPADLQNYEIASEDSLPKTLKELYNIFKSIHIFHLLKQYTELDLVPETDAMKPKMKIELQRWSRGCYMLINNKEVTESIQDIEEEEEEEEAENSGTDEEVDDEEEVDEEEVYDEVYDEEVHDEEVYDEGADDEGIDDEGIEDEGIEDEGIEDEGIDDEEVADEEITKAIQDTGEETEDDGTDEPQDAESYKACSKDSKSVATGSHETIPMKFKNQSVPEKITPNNPDGRNETKVADKSPQEKDKVSMSEIISSDFKNLSERESTAGVSGEIESSDIEDYLSDPYSNSGSDVVKSDGEEKDIKPGTLDVLLQFHTKNATEDATIDYIDPHQKDGALIHIPPQDNHLCLVYRTPETCRCNKYVNHYCKDYFYTLVCSYYE